MINGVLPKIYIDYLKDKKATICAVGPMSKNCVEATIEIANEKKVPIMMIASRRQIDSKDFGGGYVNNWDTRNFSKFVKKKDKNNFITLCRDHGGPWQNDIEIKKKLNISQAMRSAKKSYMADIDSDFKIIHIDTSLSLKGVENDKKKALKRLFELYKFCNDYAKKKNKEIFFEIGTEEQSGTTNTQKELDETLKKTIDFCNKNRLKKPTFVVIQSGTRVMETRNVGTFDIPFRVENEIPAEIQVPKMIEICKKYNIFMKAHNTDYLSSDALSWHPRLGIHAANIAPEFGVTETKKFLEILNIFRLDHLKKDFINLSLRSNKWKKWMIKNSKANNYEKSIIAGHYIFSNPKFLEIKENAAKYLKKKKNLSLDKVLKKEIKKSILRYLYNFNLVE
jgi:tagatose-1,6-bisphosphate aldolase non-catalytic subunit AgaZ/GatZ